jgi:hypothetical protein
MQISKHIDFICAVVGGITVWLGLCGDSIFSLNNGTQAIIASSGLTIILVGAFYPLYLKYRMETRKQ